MPVSRSPANAMPGALTAPNTKPAGPPVAASGAPNAAGPVQESPCANGMDAVVVDVPSRQIVLDRPVAMPPNSSSSRALKIFSLRTGSVSQENSLVNMPPVKGIAPPLKLVRTLSCAGARSGLRKCRFPCPPPRWWPPEFKEMAGASHSATKGARTLDTPPLSLDDPGQDEGGRHDNERCPRAARCGRPR